MMLVMIGILIAFPQLALWLPALSQGRRLICQRRVCMSLKQSRSQRAGSRRHRSPLGAAAAPTRRPCRSTTFNVVGSIGNLSMYTNREVPFWTETMPKESNGAIKVQVKPFTELGFKGAGDLPPRLQRHAAVRHARC